MDYSNISGFDLFGMPFSRKTQAAKPSQAPKQQESRTQSAVQKPSAAQPQNPVAKPEQIAAPEKQAETVKPSAALYKPSPEPSGQKKENPVLQKEDQEKQKDKAPEPKMDKDPVPEQQPDAAAISPKSFVSEQPQPEPPKKELVLDMSDGTAAAGIPLTASDEEKRRAYEAAEEKRKVEWEANQKAKKKKEEAEIQKLQNMSDADVTAASTERIRTDVEKITRRNMKEAVSEHIQKLCGTAAFARKTMHPRKSMARCFKYINRQARDYVKQEMEENGIKPDNGGYGCDVPDGIVYQWAEDYFNDPDAPEDQEKEETFVPRPYTGAAAKSKKPASKPKKAAKPAKKETQETASNDYEQMTLGV